MTIHYMKKHRKMHHINQVQQVTCSFVFRKVSNDGPSRNMVLSLRGFSNSGQGWHRMGEHVGSLYLWGVVDVIRVDCIIVSMY